MSDALQVRHVDDQKNEGLSRSAEERRFSCATLVTNVAFVSSNINSEELLLLSFLALKRALGRSL